MLRRVTATLLALVLLCTIPAAAAEGSSYSDVPPGDWSVSAIEKAREYGLMDGIGNGNFGYGQQMNRASFVKVLCNMFGWAEVKPAAPSYTDMQGHWSYGWVEAALQHGALEPGGAFRPDQSITREEMAVMLVRSLDYDQLAASMQNAALPFDDVTTNRGYIALAYRFGIINGGTQNGKTYFFPTQASNREVAAAMLVRAYERHTAKIDWLHGFYAFGSYERIDLTARMDAVSVGWARLAVHPERDIFLNQTTEQNNEWVVPAGADLAVNTFSANGTPYNLNVFSEGEALAAILESESSRAQGAAAIAAAVEPYNGITIDFEGLREDKKDSFTAFMSALRAALPAEKALWVAVQTPDWYKGFDYRALGDICDKVILMAHDYKVRDIPAVGSTKTDNPVTPFPKVYQALSAITDSETGVQDRSKIALAIAIDSSGCQINESGAVTVAARYSPGAATLTERLRQPDAARGWSDIYRNAYVTYTDADGKIYRVWYEDARGVMEKVRLASMFDIHGISLWRVGNIPTASDPGLEYDVWSALLTRR